MSCLFDLVNPVRKGCKMATMSVIFALFIALGVSSFADATSVPVVAWSSTKALFSTRQIAAGEEISTESLKRDFFDKSLNHQHQTVVLFLLNKLRLGDLTRYGDAYDADNQGGIISNIKSSMETAESSLVLPQTDTSDVEDHLMSIVSEAGGEIIEIKDHNMLKTVSLDPSKTNLIIVRIDSSDSVPDQLKETDKLVKDVVENFSRKSANVPYTILLTADQSSKPASVGGFRSSGRHLLQTAPTAAPQSFNYTFINFTSDGCELFFFANEIKVGIRYSDEATKDNKTMVLPTDNWSIDGSDCISNNSLLFVMSTSNIPGPNRTTSWISAFTLRMTFNTTSMGYWVINDMSTTYTLQGESTEQEQGLDLEDGLITPVGWSYHCGDVTFKKDNVTGMDTILNVHLKNFQIQPFEVRNNEFSSANDCIYYFTAPIWMGLITALLIIIIVGGGVSMLADIKVMDKWDDPKGKQLVINVAE